jgi:hypothetical protein
MLLILKIFIDHCLNRKIRHLSWWVFVLQLIRRTEVEVIVYDGTKYSYS